LVAFRWGELEAVALSAWQAAVADYNRRFTVADVASDFPQELMNPLEERLGHKFRNSLLLAEALTHPSISLERKDYPFDNQRLEFLGDAVLQVVITDYLYRAFPDFEEGQLTKMRSRIVSRNGLKGQAQAIGLGAYLMMGRGEEACGGRKRASTLADAFEAVIGAVYLDGGIEKARAFILRAAAGDLEALVDAPGDINPKGQLQELLQAISPMAPQYEITGQSGPDHQKRFQCVVRWREQELGRGDGGSKKLAEVAAAVDALNRRAWETGSPDLASHP